MSRRKNHTDQSFRDTLRQYQSSPPEGVWSGIRDALESDRRKKRIVWMRRIAASAALIIAAGSVWMLMQRTPQVDMAEAETEEFAADRQDTQTGTAGTQQPSPGTEQDSAPRESQHELSGRVQVFEAISPGPQQFPPLEEKQDMTAIAETVVPEIPGRINGKYIYWLQGDEYGADAILAMRIPQPATVYPEEGIDVFEEFGEEGFSKYDRWAVGGQVSPVYSYRDLDVSANASVTTGYLNDIESGIVSYAAGVNINYFPAKRLSLQSGLYYSRMGMTVGNTYLASVDKDLSGGYFPPVQSSMANSSGQIELGSQKTDALFFNALRGNTEDASTYYNTGNTWGATEGEILQHFEYIELPMILRYRLVDRRLGFNLLGGLSTNFLVGSNTYFQQGDDREYIGTTGDLKTVNYSSVLGLGLQFSIKPNFHINMEPTFRYYLNSINTGSGIGSHPYSLGFYTGISYSF